MFKLSGWRLGLSSFALLGMLMTCAKQEQGPLPILGNKETLPDGTVRYHTIPELSFTDQDSLPFTWESLQGKIHVADFFFVSCPSICPMVTRQMLRVHEAFQNTENLLLVSYSIDPKRDTVGRLANYARNLDADTRRWKFLTGDKARLLGIAGKYFSIALENPDAPGGFDHSGRLILVDSRRRVRAFCDGTDPDSVTAFMASIRQLLQEEERLKGPPN